MMHLALFGPFFFFLLSFINTNYYIQIRMGWFREGSDDENKYLLLLNPLIKFNIWFY